MNLRGSMAVCARASSSSARSDREGSAQSLHVARFVQPVFEYQLRRISTALPVRCSRVRVVRYF